MIDSLKTLGINNCLLIFTINNLDAQISNLKSDLLYHLLLGVLIFMNRPN